jgi:hypothetical protein
LASPTGAATPASKLVAVAVPKGISAPEASVTVGTSPPGLADAPP